MFINLENSVGNNLTNVEEDVLAVKFGLSEAGFMDISEEPEPHGIITRDMDDGIGHLITSVEEAKKLPFQVYENGKPVRIATDEEIETLYNQTQKIEQNGSVAADRYDPQRSDNAHMQNIRLVEKDVDSVFKKDLRIHAKEMRRNWKIVDVDSLPDEMQRIMLDIQFNIGGTKFIPSDWDGLKKAILAKDWVKASKEVSRITNNKARNEESMDIVRSIDKKQKGRQK